MEICTSTCMYILYIMTNYRYVCFLINGNFWRRDGETCVFLVEKDVFLTARRRKMCFLLIEKDVFLLAMRTVGVLTAARAAVREKRRSFRRRASGGP